MSHFIRDILSESEIVSLVRRMELIPSLVRQQQEELIIEQVPLPAEWVEEQRLAFLGDQDLEHVLAARGWNEADLNIYLRRSEALRLFARQRFGPGLEDSFLASRGGRDQVIYSLLRVRDAGLARELWIRLEERETTFAEAANQHGAGEEAQRNGLIGPTSIGLLQPEVLQDMLRGLKPGELSAPRQLGDWHVLLRLEQLQPARFDDAMRSQMEMEQLNTFLEDRTNRVLAGEADSLEAIHYDPES